MEIKIYTTPTCGYCHQAKQYLQDKGVHYIEYDVSRDREAANEMVQATGQMGVPVIVVDGQSIVGFNRPLLDRLLAESSKGKHPSFGLSIADAAKVTLKSGAQPVQGAFVGKVAPGSPGVRAGLRPGDIITSLNSRPVSDAADMEQALSALNTGSRVSITFIRESAAHQSEIII